MIFIRYSVVMLSISLFSAVGFSQEKYVKGVVFEDTNKNRMLDPGEPLLKDIPVSSMSEIVLTNKDGLFELPIAERDVIFIIKPSKYHFHLRSNFVPDFFHLIYPDGSPDFLNYPGVESASIPDTLYFPLLPSAPDDNILVNMVADPQMPREREVWFFRESIIPAMAAVPADFTIFLGDIADNNLGIYPPFMASLKALNTPVYGVFGNHDVNYRSPGNDFSAETFRANFGP
ncbi:MAG TPA: metallophosphoesterase family protein, partial [Bacteroidales bacterium]|nr:metallophosphoesterase family protein [Bacteroidales bacterium]